MKFFGFACVALILSVSLPVNAGIRRGNSKPLSIRLSQTQIDSIRHAVDKIKADKTFSAQFALGRRIDLFFRGNSRGSEAAYTRVADIVSHSLHEPDEHAAITRALLVSALRVYDDHKTFQNRALPSKAEFVLRDHTSSQVAILHATLERVKSQLTPAFLDRSTEVDTLYTRFAREIDALEHMRLNSRASRAFEEEVQVLYNHIESLDSQTAWLLSLQSTSERREKRASQLFDVDAWDLTKPDPKQLIDRAESVKRKGKEEWVKQLAATFVTFAGRHRDLFDELHEAWRSTVRGDRHDDVSRATIAFALHKASDVETLKHHKVTLKDAFLLAADVIEEAYGEN